MKKLLPWFILVAMLIVALVPAAAAPVADLNALARYFPEDSAVFVASQFDDEFFAEIDGLVGRVMDAMPPGTVPVVPTIEQAIDQGLSQYNLSFSADIRPWLGDTIALGVLDFDETSDLTRRSAMSMGSDDGTILVAVAITDRQALTDFVSSAIEASGDEVVMSEAGGFTVFTNPDDDNAKVMIGDDVILVTNDAAIMAGELPSSSLNNNTDFNEAFAMLPESDYNASVFINLPVLIDKFSAELEDYPQIVPLLESLGGHVWGLSLIDEVNLVLDIAQVVPDLGSALSEFGLNLDMDAISPDFARFIPANVTYAGFGNNLSAQFDNAMAQAGMQANLMGSIAGMGDGLPDMTEEFGEFESTFEDLTELNLREDVINWMTGDYAFFMALNPELDLSSMFGIFQTFPLEFGLVIEATDPAAAAEAVAGITTGLDRLLVTLTAGDDDDGAEVEFAEETIGGTTVTVMNISSNEMPWPLELLMASNDEILTLGTRNSVTTVLTQDGTLVNSPVFSRAQTYVLEDYFSQTYIDPSGLLPLADLITAQANGEEEEAEAEANAEAVRGLINLIDSFTASGSFIGDEGVGVRLVLSLSE